MTKELCYLVEFCVSSPWAALYFHVGERHCRVETNTASYNESGFNPGCSLSAFESSPGQTDIRGVIVWPNECTLRFIFVLVLILVELSSLEQCGRGPWVPRSRLRSHCVNVILNSERAGHSCSAYAPSKTPVENCRETEDFSPTTGS